MKREYTREEIIERIKKFANGDQDPHAAYKSFWDEVIDELEKGSKQYYIENSGELTLNL